ncbi:hypothetical protein AVEN_74904-1 [Araneus ventricosus]|uniref:Mos1 transposase HTH domain-containing protein n=1 Tax=Araneus ventricosus TaxID=182803 RepID=A0A4Y2MBE7_ARAVE|nr:hypothetical protein AVEN_74904-1 [Araneus ventricosus]
MDSSRSAQRAVNPFLRAEGEHASQIYHGMKEEYGEQCLARCTIFRWCQRYEAGRVNIKNLPRPGQAHVVTNSATIFAVDELIYKNRWITTREIAVELSVSKRTVRHIIHKKLGYGKRLRNNADRKAHNLYLNHTQATPNAEYVDYEGEETDCSSDISEVILNLNTYKPSTSNCLISLTDPKCKQLTPFVAKSSQMRLGPLPSLGLPSTAAVGDWFGVWDRAVAAIASSVLHDVGLITSNNSDLVVDENKLRRGKAKVRKDLKFKA